MPKLKNKKKKQKKKKHHNNEGSSQSYFAVAGVQGLLMKIKIEIEIEQNKMLVKHFNDMWIQKGTNKIVTKMWVAHYLSERVTSLVPNTIDNRS